LYTKIQEIYSNKLVEDGFSKEIAYSNAFMMTATIEGGMMLCITKNASTPLKTISDVLPYLLKENE
jgi:TetR/AcrR family transcriptional repressor of lmrAB and yxaGH operons